MIDSFEIMKWVRALQPKIGKMSFEEQKEVMDLLWQLGIFCQQFHDISKCILYFIRHPEDRKALRGELKTHLADCLLQTKILCLLFDLDLDEVEELGLKRLKDHFLHEILPKLENVKKKSGVKTRCIRI